MTKYKLAVFSKIVVGKSENCDTSLRRASLQNIYKIFVINTYIYNITGTYYWNFQSFEIVIVILMAFSHNALRVRSQIELKKKKKNVWHRSIQSEQRQFAKYTCASRSLSALVFTHLGRVSKRRRAFFTGFVLKYLYCTREFFIKKYELFVRTGSCAYLFCRPYSVSIHTRTHMPLSTLTHAGSYNLTAFSVHPGRRGGGVIRVQWK